MILKTIVAAAVSLGLCVTPLLNVNADATLDARPALADADNLTLDADVTVDADVFTDTSCSSACADLCPCPPPPIPPPPTSPPPAETPPADDEEDEPCACLDESLIDLDIEADIATSLLG